MKKSLICLVLASALLLLCCGAAMVSLREEVPQLELRTLSGDPSVLDGLRLEMLYSRDKLLWTVEKTFGGETAVQAEVLNESRASEQEERFWQLRFGEGTPGRALFFDEQEWYWPHLDNRREFTDEGRILLQRLYDSLPEGGDAEKTLQYRDVHSSRLVTKIYKVTQFGSDQEQGFLKELEDSFVFHVREEHDLPLVVRLDRLAGDAEYGEQLQMQSHTFSLICGDSLYFVPDLRDARGRLLDYSETPGGYALYRLPVDDRGQLQSGKAEAVLPLDESQRVSALLTDDRTGEPLMLVFDGEKSTLLTLDGSPALDIPLPRPLEAWTQDEGIVLCNSAEDLAVIRRTDSGFALQYALTLNPEAAEQKQIQRKLFLRDDRVFIAEYGGEPNFTLRAYGPEGRLFSGELQETIRDGVPEWLWENEYIALLGGLEEDLP